LLYNNIRQKKRGIVAQEVEVHALVCEKHKELSEEDVLCAWSSRLICQMRTGPWPPQYVAVGFDGKGHALQMVATYDPEQDFVLIFHAMALTGSVRKELGLD
jgi:hypothetical protein